MHLAFPDPTCDDCGAVGLCPHRDPQEVRADLRPRLVNMLFDDRQNAFDDLCAAADELRTTPSCAAGLAYRTAVAVYVEIDGRYHAALRALEVVG